MAGSQADATPPPQVDAASAAIALGQPSAAAPQDNPPAGTDPNQAQGDGIVVTARESDPADPLDEVNVQSFKAVQSVDKAVVGPVAQGYKKAVPSPIRSGLRNILSNLSEPIVFLNYLLQFKLGKSAETLGRFTVNSTLGFAGLFDIAKKKPFHLPHRNNGFGYTLGYYGVKTGPYLYLPLIGPTTVRDLFGRVVDLSVLPAAVGQPFNDPAFAIPTTTVRLLDERAESQNEVEAIRASADPYATVRDNYLRQRQAEIDALHGRTAPAEPTGTVPEDAQPLAPALPYGSTTPDDAPASGPAAEPATAGPTA